MGFCDTPEQLPKNYDWIENIWVKKVVTTSWKFCVIYPSDKERAN